MAPVTSLQVADAYVDTWNRNDAAAAGALFTADACLVIYPKHLGVPDTVGRDAITSFMSGSFKVIVERKAEIIDVCAEDTRVWAHVVGTAKLINGENWVPDTIYMFDLVKQTDGTLKITKLTEMVDSVEVLKVVAAVAEAKK